MSKLTMTRDSDTTVTFTRHFAATPQRVFDAHTKPELIKQWLWGPDGWSMPVCENDLRVGGKIRYEWKNDADGNSFSLTGEYEIVQPLRTVHVERMHLPDPTPESRVDTQFHAAAGGGTTMTMRMTLPDAETLEATLATGMADGMETSFARLENSTLLG